MKDKIKELLKSSHSIDDSAKAIYLKLLDFIDEDKQKQLMAIFQVEQDSIEKIQSSADLEKSALNRSFTLTIEDFFNSEHKKAIASEEKEEQDASGDILKQLDNV